MIGEENIRRAKAEAIGLLGKDKELQDLRDLTKRLQEKMETYATTTISAVETFKKLEDSYVQNQAIIEIFAILSLPRLPRIII